jgi:hypothetical protein
VKAGADGRVLHPEPPLVERYRKMRRSTWFILFGLFAGLVSVLHANAGDLSAHSSLVRVGSWTETWPTPDGASAEREVTGEIWTEAIQAALDRDHRVHIPARAKPYYLDAPLVLRSGDTLTADTLAEIRLKPNTNTCLVRNESIVGFNTRVVPADLEPDSDIRIEGGIWTTLATGPRQANGNKRGHSSKENYVHGTHGVILLHNVRNVAVRNVTIRQSKAFGVHLGNARDFLVDGVTLEEQRRDGVHVNGPASQGVIRNVHGDSHDDTVALNAWEWRNYAPSFGAIHHIRIDHVAGAPPDKPSANSIRLLPGVKRFPDGNILDCSIHDIALLDVTDITEFKLYEQPNLEHGRDNDSSIEPGTLRNIRMERLALSRPGAVRIAAEVEGLRIDGVDLRFSPADDFALVEIGPMSMTWKHGDDPAKWVEVFAPDRDVTIKNLHVGTIRVNGESVPDASSRFVAVRDQKINPDYPQSTPRGGTGKARLVD